MPFERVANSCRPLDQPPHRTARYRRCCLAILRGACPMPAARTGLLLLELESSRITLAGRWLPRTTIQTIDACRPAPGQTAVSQRGGRARPPSHWFLKRSLVLTKQGID